MRIHFISFFLVVALCGSLAMVSGCADKTVGRPAVPSMPHALQADPPPGSAMLTANTYAGDVLAAMLLQRIGAGSGILATSFVDMENVDSSSPFGRTSMQQVSSRVAQHGFKVLEVRLGDSLRMIPGTGELMLTRDSARVLEQEHDAHAVLVGMYSHGSGKVFVSARVIRLVDTAVIATYEYFVPLDGDAGSMMQESGGSNAAWQSSSNADAWRRYAARGRAFPKNAAPVEGQPERNKSTAGYSQQRESGSSAARSGGMVIDPNAAPMPFPGGKRK